MALNVTINGGVTFGGNSNVSSNSKPAETHDLSAQILNNPTKEFTLNPAPVVESLIVSLDGLLLRKSPDNVQGDYTYDNATSKLTLLVSNLEDDAVLLAIYQEA